MGTSISQPSSNASVWSAVSAGYRDARVPPERIASDVWRAGVSESPVLEQDLRSDLVFKTFVAATESSSPREAFGRISKISDENRNSIIGECAQRAAISVAGQLSAHEAWPKAFFAQVTDYFVSRDISGYVGGNGRLKNASDLTEFKDRIRKAVEEKIKTSGSESSSKKKWDTFVTKTLASLRK